MEFEDMSFEEKFNHLLTLYPMASGRFLSQQLYQGGKIQVDGIAEMPVANPGLINIWAHWILDSPKILELMEHSKINAIKEVRSLTFMGLKEAKDVVEYTQRLIDQGVVGKLEAERLDKDVRQVIKSLTGGEDG